MASIDVNREFTIELEKLNEIKFLIKKLNFEWLLSNKVHDRNKGDETTV